MTVGPCPPPTAPTRGVVTFDATEFKGLYPAFETVADGLLQADFDVATLFLNNSCCSMVKDANVRQRMLYLATAHVAALLQGENGKPPSGIVGRIDKAAEGSVSVSAAYATMMSMSEAYFSQTQYGALFWQITAPYRSMLYVPPPPNNCIGRNPNGPGFPWGSGGRC